MISNFSLKSILSSFLGSLFFLDPILSRISLADMFRLRPPKSDLSEEPGGSGDGVLRGLEPDVELLPNAF